MRIRSPKSTNVIPIDPDRLIVTLNVEELNALVREAVRQEVGAVRPGDDGLVNITEAARVLSVTKDWIYHNRKRLPFVRRAGPRSHLRFSVRGMQEWISARETR